MQDAAAVDPIGRICYRRAVLRASLLAIVVLPALWATPAAAASNSPKSQPSHWVDKTSTLPNEPLTVVAVDPADDRVIYAGLDGFLFRSDDGGETFAPVLSVPRGVGDDGGLGADEADSTSFDETGNDVGTNAALEEAEDDARDFRNDTADEGVNDVDDLPDGDFDVRRGSGTSTIADDLAVPARVEAGVRAVVFVPGSAGVLLVATSRGLYRSTNAATSFVRLPLPGPGANDVRDVGVDPDRPTTLYVGTAAGLMISRDGGATFTPANGRVGRAGVVCIAVVRGVVVVGSERGLLRSRNNGADFDDLLLRGQPAFPVIHAVALADEGRVVYAGVSDGLWAAERNSPILEHYEGMPNDAPTVILPDPKNVGGVVIATRSQNAGGAFFSNDIGLTSVDIEALPATQILGLARESKDGARLWAATERGLFRLEPGTGIRVSKDELVALRERFAQEPPLDVLIERALVYNRTDVDFGAVQARAGWAGLLPELRAGYQFDYGDTNQARTQFLFVVGVGQPPTSDPEAEFTDRFNNGLVILQPEQRLDHRVWINLVWDLDRVVLSPQLPTLGRNAMTNSRNQQSVADAVRSFYIMRRRLLAEATLDAKRPLATTSKKQLSRIHKELEILEVEARLAGLVGEDVFDSPASHPVLEER